MSYSSSSTERRIKVYVEPASLNLMLAATSSLKEEIGGFLHVRTLNEDVPLHKAGAVYVHTASITPQEVTTSDVWLNTAWQAEESHKAGLSEEWKGWWHSHNSMGVFLSGDDDKVIDQFGQTADWWLSLVTNHKWEWFAQIDVFNVPFVGHVKLKGDVLPAITTEEWDRAGDLIKERVTVKSYQSTWQKGKSNSSSSKSKKAEDKNGKRVLRASMNPMHIKGMAEEDRQLWEALSGEPLEVKRHETWAEDMEDYVVINGTWFAVDPVTDEIFNENDEPSGLKVGDVEEFSYHVVDDKDDDEDRQLAIALMGGDEDAADRFLNGAQ